MAGETAVSASVLESIRTDLARGRSGLEDTASSAPSGIDAGELTAMLTSMMSRVSDSAAVVSDSLGAVSAQVSEAGTSFWQVDGDVASAYGGR